MRPRAGARASRPHPPLDARAAVSAWDVALCLRNVRLRRMFRPSESDLDCTAEALAHVMCRAAHDGDLPTIRRLLEKGESVDK
eukprot:1405824-Prymnesium_polylepis.1